MEYHDKSLGDVSTLVFVQNKERTEVQTIYGLGMDLVSKPSYVQGRVRESEALIALKRWSSIHTIAREQCKDTNRCQ